MATIKKRGNTFLITVSAGFDGNGKRRRIYETYMPHAKTPKAQLKEVQHYAELLQEQADRGKLSIDKGMTFAVFVKVWETDWAKDHLTASGLSSYKNHLRNHITPVFGNYKLSKIKKADCIHFVSVLKDKGLAAKTIKRIMTAFRSVLDYAVYLDLITDSPAQNLKLPSNKKTQEFTCFDVVEAQRFLNALSLQFPHHTGVRTRKDSSGETYSVKGYVHYREIPLQFQIFFHLAIVGGFRRGELLALTWSDINFTNQTISINKAVSATDNGYIVGDPKTVSSFRDVYLPHDCFDMLANWLDMQKEQCTLSAWKGMPLDRIMENNVFIQDDGTRMNLYTPQKRFQRILTDYNALIEAEAAKLATEEQKKKKLQEKLPVIRLHDLRHTFASICIGNGLDVVTVSKLMGHASPSITMDVYSHLLKKNAKDAAETFERLFTPVQHSTEEHHVYS